MKIKRFFAPDIRQAMRMVREQQGPDAVILSNRNVDGGVEIVAAQDYDEKSLGNNFQAQIDRAKSQPLQGRVRSGNRVDSQSEHSRSGSVDKAMNLNALRSKRLERDLTLDCVASRDSKDSLARKAADGQGGFQGSNGELRKDRKERNPDLSSLHREIKQMRRLLDSHLSLTPAGPFIESPIRLDFLRQFSQWGFSKKVAMELSARVEASDDEEIANRQGMDALASRIRIWKNDINDSGGVLALVGPTGVGKTTTIAKLAAGFRLIHGPSQVALISIDNYRIGAYEQLNIYGRILGVPVRNASTPGELRDLLDEYADKRLVLIDTAGMGHRDTRVARQCSFLNEVNKPIQTHVVISAATQYHIMKQVVEAYQGFRLDGCILTKLDESTLLGPALSVAVEEQLPLSFITDGQRVPEDISPAYPNILVERCFAEDALGNNSISYSGQRVQRHGFDAHAVV